LTKLGREAPPVMFGQRMVLQQRVIRPPRPKPTNGKAQRR